MKFVDDNPNPFSQPEFETPQCIVCQELSYIELETVAEARALVVWRQGTPVQVAFPFLSSEDREMLITGTHPQCWEDTIRDYDAQQENDEVFMP